MKLKPCPFCGGKAIIYEEIIFGSRFYSAECVECSAKIQMVKKKQAEKDWNKRINEKEEGTI